MEYRRGAHTVFEIHLHLVWITKYRRPALTGEIATRVRDLIRDICGQHEVSIMKGHVSKDHVHLLISLPPQLMLHRAGMMGKGGELNIQLEYLAVADNHVRLEARRAAKATAKSAQRSPSQCFSVPSD